MEKDETVKAPDFIYELMKNGDKDLFTKKEIFAAIKRAMGLKE